MICSYALLIETGLSLIDIFLKHSQGSPGMDGVQSLSGVPSAGASWVKLKTYPARQPGQPFRGTRFNRTRVGNSSGCLAIVYIVFTFLTARSTDQSRAVLDPSAVSPPWETQSSSLTILLGRCRS